MGTDKVIFAVVLCGGATGSDVTGSHVIGSHVTGRDGNHRNRKYVLRMCNRKLRHIPLVGPFDRK